jgi:hypothetical protein
VEQDLEKLPSSELDFRKTKYNFVKSQVTALRMVFLFHLSHKSQNPCIIDEALAF